MKSVLIGYHVITLENNKDDERVRDHLANERTYLAWMRTSISTMGFGIVIAKLRYLFAAGTMVPSSSGVVHASNIGLLFTVVGLLTAVIATRHFFQIRKQIREQRYNASSGFLLAFVGVVAVLGVAIIWYLVTSR